MEILNSLSGYIIPFVVFFVVIYGVSKRTKVYENFIDGAKDGIKTVVGILPTLIGLMVGVRVLRASGFLDFVGRGLGKLFFGNKMAPDLMPIIIVRMFSSSAATGLCLDIFKNYGADSVIGYTVSILMSCTETIFYTMSVYFMAARVTKTRWTLAGALLSTFAGVAASIVLGICQKN